MKKRFISLLLTVLMILSLFSGLSVNAYAATTAYGANTIEYTMGQGDYVLRICQKLGLNYYTCKDAIMILNNIYDGQWSKLAVGRVLTLPASDNDAVLIANGARTTTYNSGAAATTASTGTVITGTATTGTVSTANSAAFTAAKSADTLAYYLVPYTMSYGETVSGVCNNLGVNFSIFNPFIKQVNNISDWSKVRAGDTIIVPTPVCPVVGTTCYGVMQHVVTGSDTAYGIVSSKGVNYNANELLLKALNQTDNLAAIRAGSNFFYPVPLTVSVPGTGNPGSTATTTTVTTVSDGNGTTTTSTTTTSKLYTLTSGMAASDGTMLFYVNNQAVTAAPAGAKVTIVTQTYSGRAVQSLTVKQADGKADLHLTSDTFVMPSCNVRVDASIKTGHDINITANYSGKAAASVGGVSVSSAVKGSAVVIKSTDPNYEISAVYAYYAKTLAASTKTALTVSSSKAFIMPDANVEVEVVLRPVSTYAFYVNDPVKGSFYLQVNGNSVTRAAKGSTVTVVIKSNEGYEPVALNVWKHGGNKNSDSLKVFSNTFTMPGYDVDVEVKFGAKGNNILIMPSQIGNVYAFTDATADISTYEKLEENSVTDAETGEEVLLKVIDETGTEPSEISVGYKIDYDVVRNSDGLKVSVDKTQHTFSMPKGGVTVTPIITANDTVEVNGEIWMNNETTAANSYRDCSFSITYKDGTKEKRAEFKGKGDKAVDIPVFEYVDLRYETSSGVAFVRYKVEVKGNFDADDLTGDEWSELLTNQANNGAYFQIPDGATNVTIKAYFENGKVPMGPAVLEGIGSVSYKVSKDKGLTWKSANSCDPGDMVLLVVTAGNGYKFDDGKYESRLFVTRKDNGAHIELSRAGAGIMPTPPGLDTYGYTFTMPAEGVDVKAIFDPKPFVITMKCVDEVGNDLTGLGLWQIAIDWIPGVADNGTEIIPWVGFETTFDVAYGEYVTVAMTEAGWSKYDMVSFRIDDQEYTADQLNYFYNFQMIDNRAKNLTITAVLRPKTVSAIHNLNAMYDVTKGGVEFMIIHSPSHYSDEFRMNSTGALNYVNRAIAGDKVAIVVNSVNNKYTVKASDINIIAWGGDADRIVPTEEYIDAFGKQPGTIRVFTFTMPDSDVNVTVNYSGAQRGLVVSVYDADNNSAPVSGMVRVFANNVYRDVGSDFSFADIAYKTPVQILRSELALAENKVIRDVEISTGSGKSVPYTDMTNAGEGIQFTMPDEPVWVIIRIADRYYPNVPTVVIDTQVNNGTFVYRKSANTSDPVVSLADFAPGETVYVFDEPYPGYDHLGLGDLKIYVNGVQNTVNVQQVTTVPHVWSFTMPQGTIIMKADFPLESADEVKITVAINPKTIDSTTNPTEIDVIINGYASTLKDGDSFTAYEGSAVTISACTDGYSVSSVLSGSKKGVTGNVYVVPGDLDPLTDTLTVSLTKDTYPIQWSVSEGGSMSITSGSSSNIVSAKANDKITVEVKPNDGYELANGVITVSSLSGDKEFNLELVDNKVSFEMPAEGVKITANFTRKAEAATVQFKAVGDNAKLTMSLGSATVPADGNVHTWQFPVDTVITVAAENAAFDKIDIAVDGSGVVKNNTFTVKGDATVVISFSSSKNPISAKSSTGSISFYSDTALKNAIGSAEAGQPVYILTEAVTGYGRDGQGKLDPEYPTKKDDASAVTNIEKWKNIIKITSKADGSSVIPQPRKLENNKEAALYFVMPAGGVDVTVTYPANTITISFNIDNSAVPDAAATVNVKIGDSSIVVENGKSVTATVGQKVVISSTNSKAGIGSVTPTIAKQSAVSGSTFTVPATDVATEVLTVKLSKGSSLNSSEWNFFSAEEDNAAAENDALNDAGEEYEEPAAYDEAAAYEEAPAENEAPAAYEPAPEQTED